VQDHLKNIKKGGGSKITTKKEQPLSKYLGITIRFAITNKLSMKIGIKENRIQLESSN